MIDIFSLSVEEMALKIKEGQLTSVEVCEKYIERINKFEKDVKAFYEGSELFAEKADYSNSNGLITILENVIVKDYRGTLLADKLLFDLKKQNLQILSYNDNKINAKVEIK